MKKILFTLADLISFGRISYLEKSIVLLQKEKEELKNEVDDLKEQVKNAQAWQKEFQPLIQESLERTMMQTFNEFSK